MTQQAAHRAGRRRALPARKNFKKLSPTPVESAEKSPVGDAVAVPGSEDLVSLQKRIQQLVDTFKFEEARDLCAKAVQLAPEDADLQYLMGTICLEVGDFVNGFEHIRNSIHLRPETTPDRFFAFAQLLSGSDALQVYEHGLGIFNATATTDRTPEMSKNASTACCSAAEIFMTDLCDEEGAELACERWLQLANSACPGNPEYYRVMADLRMCQQRPEDARVAVLEAVRLWNGELDAVLNPPPENPASASAADLLVELPSYESRIAAAKILIEVGEMQSAVSMLEQLLREDDSVLMTWYLLCLALKSIAGSNDDDDAAEALKDAIYGSLRVSRREGLFTDPERLETDDEILQEILNFATEAQLPLADLDSLEAEVAEADAEDLEEMIAEVEQNIEKGE